jgi:hypothetical protein
MAQLLKLNKDEGTRMCDQLRYHWRRKAKASPNISPVRTAAEKGKAVRRDVDMAEAGFGGGGPITVVQAGRWIGPTNNVANVVEAYVKRGH